MNRLNGATSPYLRQHAANPVDWFPWGDEAFAEARRRDVPVLLSVGYSACHWCHVMAHESFEDPATAEVMNRLFVNVKVDREERPDVDAVYMEAVQAHTGRGGWPMTVFMTPDAKPFFGGTYFPNERRHGMPSFVELCHAIDDAWHNRRGDLEAQAAELASALGRAVTGSGAAAATVGLDRLGEAAGQLIGQADRVWGGFGGAPKFPQAMAVEFLLRWHVRTGSAGALQVAQLCLDAMAAGGIYDHLGGGFSRYATDREWLVPHFEKMLYDNALLLRAYLHAWQLTGSEPYRRVVEETVRYVLRDLAQPGGGWASAEDADSEGEEGRFYVWQPEELRALLGADADAVMDWYGVSEAGNFEGRSILNRRAARDDLVPPPVVQDARRTLFEARAKRVRPGLDDKCLAEWNALMLSALAEAATALDRPDWLAAAVANAEFLVRELRRADGRWLRSWQAGGGASPVPAFAADHAALVDAFVRVAEASGEARWIQLARETADALLEHFWDDADGGFFTTGTDAEALITRPKELMDNAVPSASSLGAFGLIRLAALTGEQRYRGAATAVLATTAEFAVQHPTAFGQLLVALELAGGTDGPPLTEVVVTGDRPDLVRAAQARWSPRAVLAWGEAYPSPLWEGREPGRAFLCEGAVCRLPIDDPVALDAALAHRSPPVGGR